MFTCTFCSFRSENNVVFVRHLFDAHSSESNFNYVCGISSCGRNFATDATYEAFCDHCTRYHHNWRRTFIPTTGIEELTIDATLLATTNESRSSIEDDDIEDTLNCVEETLPFLESHGTEIVPVHRPRDDDTSRMKMAAGNFVLTVKEKFKLTQASLNYIMQTVNEITKLSANNIKQSVMKELQGSGSVIAPCLNQCFLPVNPFDELNTEYQQTKFFKEKFGLVVSE